MLENVAKRESPLVLIVDDDRVIRLLSRQTLELADFWVEEAEDGLKALTIFEHKRPDIVLLDVMMPEMDGFTVCSKIRTLLSGETTPVLMMTGLDDIESINRAFEAGATDFLTKPINWALLGHRVRYMLRASDAIENLHKSEAKNRALLNAIPDLLFQIGKDGIFLEFRGVKNISLSAHTDKIIGNTVFDMMPSHVAQPVMHYLEKALQTKCPQIFEFQLLVNGNKQYCEARIVASGEDKALAIVRDITEHKEAEEKIFYLAYHDTLTDLPNRHLLKDRLSQAIAHAERKEHLVATLLLDLDRFKRINDTLGHNAGDLLLQGVADRLLKCVRKSDSVARLATEELNPIVARLGGDEFIVLLTDIKNIQSFALVSQRILDALSQAFVLGTNEVFITASIGIAVYPFDGKDVDTLLKNADTAMYQAKDHGKNNCQFYTESMNAVALERFIMENQLRKALAFNEFQLYYQPQVDINTGEILGVEALIRWLHPDKGLILPEAFIPLAEETGLIVTLGEWVLRTACAQSRAWQIGSFVPISVAVNLSSVQFRQKNFVETVTNILNNTGLDPHYLKLELTESVIMDTAEEAIAKWHALKAMGVQLLIDDFGTGYSSLSYLKRFPLSTIKIDQSFVQDVITDPDDAAITKAIIALAHSLNLNVIAEGVETEQQVAFLSKHGCDGIQGYLISRPLPADELIQFLQEGKYSHYCKNHRLKGSERG